MKTICFTVQLEVNAPVTTEESEIVKAINTALAKSSSDWEDWTVGPATVTCVKVKVGRK